MTSPEELAVHAIGEASVAEVVQHDLERFASHVRHRIGSRDHDSTVPMAPPIRTVVPSAVTI